MNQTGGAASGTTLRPREQRLFLGDHVTYGVIEAVNSGD